MEYDLKETMPYNVVKNHWNMMEAKQKTLIVLFNLFFGEEISN